MDLLQRYASDSDTETSTHAPQQQSASASSSTPAAPSDGAQHAADYDPSDAFGLSSLGASNAATDDDPQDAPPSKRRRAHPAPSRAGPSSAVAPSFAAASSSSMALTLAAPEVVDNSASSNALLTRPTDTTMHVNIPYKDMTAPVLGPQNPFASEAKRRLGAKQNTLSGHVEAAAITDYDFRNQQRTFDVQGYARNPSLLGGGAVSGSWVGNAAAAAQAEGASAFELRGGGKQGRATAKELKKKRKGQNGDTSIVEGEGAYIGPWGGWSGEKVHVEGGVGPTEAEIARAEELSTNRKIEKEKAEAKRLQEEEAGTERSIFHGNSMYDYQGRTYMHVPTDVDVNLAGEPGATPSYLPKSCVHTFTGHTKGISALRLFPQSGHLMLSASMDTKVKLWDVYHEGNCLRTFMGHSKAVRDICFSNDGRRFLSAGYDRQIKLWDTETGACLQAFSNGKVPYCIKFHPDEDKQNVFLAGMSDKKVIQYDLNAAEITQEYNQHLGPVNTITFVDQNRRFVTTSDDKTMRAWDYNIPVQIKYIADPTLHSMPAVTLHPNKKWLACQSMDNQIVVYGADSFKQNRNKAFKGHAVAGFAAQVGFSPDGRFISSGDGEGNLVFWDWKSGRLLKRISRAHKEASICHEWLPHESSKLVSGGWDGVIKMWD
ncbi:hypothetical protein ACQY0O_003540 [Thecaphora frezii]